MTCWLVHLWTATGRPPPNWQGKAKTTIAAPSSRPGVCALTGTPGDVWPIGKVSTTLTAWDRFPHRDTDPAGMALGPAAAWAFRCRIAMQQPHILSPAGVVAAQPAQLFGALIHWTPTSWVSVPQSRQKHLLPYAQPGTVQVDNETLRWDTSDTGRLHAYQQLRAQGFGETALAEPVPRFVILTKTPHPADMLRLWPTLDPWRQHPAYLDVAARATRTPKDQDEPTETDNSTDA